MSNIEKAITYVGSYFMLFFVAISLDIMDDLPLVFDLIIFSCGLYIIAVRDDILIQHISGYNMVCNGGVGKRIVSVLIKIIIGLVIIKIMLLGGYQYVLILYLIDYLTWALTDRSLVQVMSLTTIERKR